VITTAPKSKAHINQALPANTVHSGYDGGGRFEDDEVVGAGSGECGSALLQA
jgi:hypothetical protein